MVRDLWLVALLSTAAIVPAQSAADVVRTPTAAMLKFLRALEPENGWLATPPGLTDEQWQYYRRVFAIAPDGNEPDDTRIGLGRLLFFDQRLSRDRSLSCASCHDPKHGFTEPRAKSVGIGGRLAARNAPTLLNAALQKRLFWDGRVETLEEQAAMPLLHPAEMGMPDRDAVVARVREVPEYVALFDLAYGREPTFPDIARALAAFQRTLVFLDAPFDAFRAGDEHAIGEDAKEGLLLFTKHCRSCHPISLREPLLSDGNFHNVGVGFAVHDHRAIGREAFPQVRAGDRDPSRDNGDLVSRYGELGRALITKLEYQVGAFRTPSLRNVALTAPYMHDGSMATLWDVVGHYDRGGTKNAWQDPQIVPLGLEDEQIDQLVAFLFTLTDRRLAAAGERAFAAQRRQARGAATGR